MTIQNASMLALLVAQAEGQGADMVTLRALIEEASGVDDPPLRRSVRRPLPDQRNELPAPRRQLGFDRVHPGARLHRQGDQADLDQIELGELARRFSAGRAHAVAERQPAHRALPQQRRRLAPGRARRSRP